MAKGTVIYLETNHQTELMTTLEYLAVLQAMFLDIAEAYSKEKDPLARCELAKGFCMIGEVLRSAGRMG